MLQFMFLSGSLKELEVIVKTLFKVGDEVLGML